ncbi:MAG: UDP-N-acetylmuramate--L-alanine ligase [Oscillospiraceae bacterium]|nr:UDP-N-acetylmuramate--L-alanine ligase [Oscillospiraceae bacterium]
MDIFGGYVNKSADAPAISRVHMLGINGISMSGLSELLLHMGYSVSGSDINLSERTRRLEAMGATIFEGNRADNIKDGKQDIVVYTSAIRRGNPELERAIEIGAICIERAVLLGLITSNYSKSIAVSGSHGKTTTTSMITEILMRAGYDPSAHIGAEYSPIGGATRLGSSDYFVTEACEYRESFLRLRPYIAVITNVELDHVDYYRDISHLKEAFRTFATQVPAGGFVVANGDDQNSLDIYSRLPTNEKEKWLLFGMNENSQSTCSVYVENLEFDSNYCGVFELCFGGGASGFGSVKRRASKSDDSSAKHRIKVHLNTPGAHNVYNALAAAATCHVAGCASTHICNGLSAFNGAQKRFERKGVFRGMTIIDDYAHHPSEIKYALETGRKITSSSKLICVFQPHTYSRTEYFMDELAEALKIADITVLADIFSAREKDPGDVNSGILADRIVQMGGNAIHIGGGFDKIAKYVSEKGAPGDVVITMGAGESVKVADILLSGDNI